MLYSHSGHSFCIGAGTAAAQADIPDHMIKALDCWETEAYQTYSRTCNRICNSPHSTCILLCILLNVQVENGIANQLSTLSSGSPTCSTTLYSTYHFLYCPFYNSVLVLCKGTQDNVAFTLASFYSVERK